MRAAPLDPNPRQFEPVANLRSKPVGYSTPPLVRLESIQQQLFRATAVVNHGVTNYTFGERLGTTVDNYSRERLLRALPEATTQVQGLHLRL